METVLLVIHLLIVLALIGTVLLQRSEGGALGMGGGGSGGGFMTARGAANVLTRTTAILAAAFFATSIMLAIIARPAGTGPSVIDGLAPQQNAPAQAPGNAGSLLDSLGGTGAEQPREQAPQVPQSQ